MNTSFKYDFSCNFNVNDSVTLNDIEPQKVTFKATFSVEDTQITKKVIGNILLREKNSIVELLDLDVNEFETIYSVETSEFSERGKTLIIKGKSNKKQMNGSYIVLLTNIIKH